MVKTATVAVAFIICMAAIAFAITPASNWTMGTSGKYSPTTAGGFVTAGGNVTDINIESNQSTSKWAGIYGNVSGSITLAKNSTVIFYTWTWTPVNGAKICASTNSSFGAITSNGTAAGVDTAWGFTISTDMDTAANTMTSACTLANVTGSDITGSAAVNTSGVDAGTETCVSKQDTGTTKDSYVFCAPIIGTGFTFDGLLRNYAMMVPTAQSGTETYYFYLELQ
jgi:hypothetical protein